jgi:antitoxin HigA-1
MLPSQRVSAHPGRILLREFLEPGGLTQAQLARDLNISQNRINELIRGKRGITAETALLLSAYFRNSAEFWMQLQAAHDLTKARQELRAKRPAHHGRQRRTVSKPA